MISVIFYGTSDLGLPSLERLAQDKGFALALVVTQPDRPKGRHGKLTASPIKQLALKLGLAIYQPESLKDANVRTYLSTIPADIAVVASFGQIMPQTIIDLPKHGSINIHPSALPKYRGATPITAAILHGDDRALVSFIKMDALMDHGPIIFQTPAIKIDATDTTASLTPRLAQLAAEHLPDVLLDFINGTMLPREQNHESATKVPLLKREDGLLDWTKPAAQLERQLRAYHPWPGSYLTLDGKRLKVLAAAIGSSSDDMPGSRLILAAQPAVVCGDQRLFILTKVQPDGKTPMTGQEFLRGHKHWIEKTPT